MNHNDKKLIVNKRGWKRTETTVRDQFDLHTDSDDPKDDHELEDYPLVSYQDFEMIELEDEDDDLKNLSNYDEDYYDDDEENKGNGDENKSIFNNNEITFVLSSLPNTPSKDSPTINFNSNTSPPTKVNLFNSNPPTPSKSVTEENTTCPPPPPSLTKDSNSNSTVNETRDEIEILYKNFMDLDQDFEPNFLEPEKSTNSLLLQLLQDTPQQQQEKQSDSATMTENNINTTEDETQTKEEEEEASNLVYYYDVPEIDVSQDYCEEVEVFDTNQTTTTEGGGKKDCPFDPITIIIEEDEGKNFDSIPQEKTLSLHHDDDLTKKNNLLLLKSIKSEARQKYLKSTVHYRSTTSTQQQQQQRDPLAINEDYLNCPPQLSPMVSPTLHATMPVLHEENLVTNNDCKFRDVKHNTRNVKGNSISAPPLLKTCQTSQYQKNFIRYSNNSKSKKKGGSIITKNIFPVKIKKEKSHNHHHHLNGFSSSSLSSSISSKRPGRSRRCPVTWTPLTGSYSKTLSTGKLSDLSDELTNLNSKNFTKSKLSKVLEKIIQKKKFGRYIPIFPAPPVIALDWSKFMNNSSSGSNSSPSSSSASMMDTSGTPTTMIVKKSVKTKKRARPKYKEEEYEDEEEVESEETLNFSRSGRRRIKSVKLKDL